MPTRDLCITRDAGNTHHRRRHFRHDIGDAHSVGRRREGLYSRQIREVALGVVALALRLFLLFVFSDALSVGGAYRVVLPDIRLFLQKRPAHYRAHAQSTDAKHCKSRIQPCTAFLALSRGLIGVFSVALLLRVVAAEAVVICVIPVVVVLLTTGVELSVIIEICHIGICPPRGHSLSYVMNIIIPFNVIIK